MEDLSCDITASPALALQQHSAYLNAIQAIGGNGRIVDLCDTPGVLASALVLTRKIGPLRLNWMARVSLASPTAPVAEQNKQLRLRELLDHVAGITLSIPDSPQDAVAFHTEGFRALMTPQHVAELDLTRPEATRHAALHLKWRNRLRHARRAGLVVTHHAFDPERHAPLLALELAQRRTRGYQALPTSFTQAWAMKNPDTVRLFQAEGSEGLCAYMLFLLHPPVATYHIGWTDHQGRASSAHNLLLWQATSWLAECGFSRLDLGLLDTQMTPGLARFKLGAGARARPLGPLMLRLPLPRRC